MPLSLKFEDPVEAIHIYDPTGDIYIGSGPKVICCGLPESLNTDEQSYVCYIDEENREIKKIFVDYKLRLVVLVSDLVCFVREDGNIEIIFSFSEGRVKEILTF